MCPSAVTSVMCCKKKLIIAAGAAGTLFFSPNRSREGNGNGTRPRSCFPMSDVLFFFILHSSNMTTLARCSQQTEIFPLMPPVKLLPFSLIISLKFTSSPSPLSSLFNLLSFFSFLFFGFNSPGWCSPSLPPAPSLCSFSPHWDLCLNFVRRAWFY